MNQIKSTPRDVFLYLLAMVTLYFNSFNLIRLFFEYISVLIPDPLRQFHDPGSAMRFSIASLMIIFPVFIWVSRFLNRDIAKSPEKAELKIRKWLVYLTLFVAALLIIGDLIALIFNFLQGDLTSQFILKMLAVLLVAVSVFGYYLYDLRKKAGEFSQNAKIFVWVVPLWSL